MKSNMTLGDKDIGFYGRGLRIPYNSIPPIRNKSQDRFAGIESPDPANDNTDETLDNRRNRLLESILSSIDLTEEQERNAAPLVRLVMEDAVSAHPQLTVEALQGLMVDKTWVERVEGAPADHELPIVAPAFWEKDRTENDTPATFIFRHYSHWMKPDNTGICLADIRKIDPELGIRYRSYIRSNRDKLPDGFVLPNIKEKNRALVDKILSGDAEKPKNLNDYMRLASTARRQGKSFSSK